MYQLSIEAENRCPDQMLKTKQNQPNNNLIRGIFQVNIFIWESVLSDPTQYDV